MKHVDLASNNPARKSWVPVPADSDFPIQNLPFGIFSSSDEQKRMGVAIGNHVLDVGEVFQAGLLNHPRFEHRHFYNDSLNEFLRLGKAAVRGLRERISELLSTESDALRVISHQNQFLLPLASVQLHLPVTIGDYTDFYSSEDHARNVGIMFRDPANALLPNWKHLPVGYHGRASSIVPSGVPVQRPSGQTRPDETQPPVFGPTKQLDFELEMAFVTFDGKPMGQRIATAEAEEYIFGMLLFNDWSARDIQKWEYVPLGPFLSKNFASSVSPWVVTLDALLPFHVSGPVQEPEVLPYLSYQGQRNINIQLDVIIETPNGEENLISVSNYRHMYWNYAQQLAHHTVNGCNIRVGDLMASGTISGPNEGSFGSMLELAWKGTKPLKLKDGSERKFIHDGDTVIMRGHCQGEGYRVGFGEVRAEVKGARG